MSKYKKVRRIFFQRFSMPNKYVIYVAIILFRNRWEIIKNSGLQVIIATHSPQIIDGKWDLTVDLFELDKIGPLC